MAPTADAGPADAPSSARFRVGGAARAVVGVNEGAVHAGEGDLVQHFYNTVAGERRRREPLSHDTVDVARLTRVFVPPVGVDGARATLNANGVVLLHGPVGAGRRASAIVLLSEHRTDESGPVQTLDTSDDQESEVLLREDVTPSALLLLDLSGVDDAAGALRRVAGLMNDIRDRGALLAAVLRRAPDRSVPEELLDSTSPIARPDGADVLGRHLAEWGVESPPRDDWSDELREFVARVPMSDVADLARQVAGYHRADPDGGFALWSSAALAVVQSFDADIAAELGGRRDGRQRTLALAAALFEGATPDVVLDAEQRLVHAVDLPDGDEHELAGPDVEDRLGVFRASVVDGRVRFHPPGRAAAVRRYLWGRFPSQRTAFHRWATGAVDLLSAATAIEPHDYVGRFTGDALGVGRPDLVVGAVETWAARPADRQLAGLALTQGVLDARYGGFFRQRCYDWATGARKAPTSLALLVVTVCAAGIAPDRPGQAVVRLYHLAHHRDPAVADTARDSLADVLADSFALHRFLRRLTERDPAPGGADQRLFLAVVDPLRLVAPDASTRAPLSDPEVAERIATCWAAVFGRLPKPEFESALRQWLTAGTRAGGGRLTDVLVRAAAVGGRTAALHAITHRWVAEPAGDRAARHDTARGLLAEMDRQRRAPRRGAKEDEHQR